jgi:hypothetical protein
MNSYDMIRGGFVEEFKRVPEQVRWYEQMRWLELQLVPVSAKTQRVTMPHDLARVVVDDFLSSQR